MKRNFIGALLKLVVAATAIFGVASCDKDNTLNESLEIKQTVSNGSFVESVNGKDLTCTLSKSKIDDEDVLILSCTNETEYDATIDVTINNEAIGTITEFPTEFKYALSESGVYQYSISGTLKTKGKSPKVVTSFQYGWSLTIGN